MLLPPCLLLSFQISREGMRAYRSQRERERWLSFGRVEMAARASLRERPLTGFSLARALYKGKRDCAELGFRWEGNFEFWERERYWYWSGRGGNALNKRFLAGNTRFMGGMERENVVCSATMVLWGWETITVVKWNFSFLWKLYCRWYF